MSSVLIRVNVNGEDRDVAVPAHFTLLELLREKLDLIGSKQGCDKGDCGACTVRIDGKNVCSCITLAIQTNGRSVRTVEGMTGRHLHPLQDCLDRSVGAQCGFCTPGILMSAEAFLEDAGRKVSREEVCEALAGNLCRCTGYTKIVDAIVEASEVMAEDKKRG
jgi:aerobic-type carbon monoxide dehydrogenase small subunit (CoxS/CutS family)